MPQTDSDSAEVLLRLPSASEIDEAGIGRIAADRFAKELAAAVRQMSDVSREQWDDRWASAVKRSAERLRAVNALHPFICGTSSLVDMARHVPALCATLIGCSPIREGFTPMRLKLDEAAVDGGMANAICLMVVAMVAGETAGGPLMTDGRVEIGFSVAADRLTVAFRDVADDPPDRLAIGGRLLIGVAHAIHAEIVTREAPGMASVEIAIPYRKALSLRTIGNA